MALEDNVPPISYNYNIHNFGINYSDVYICIQLVLNIQASAGQFLYSFAFIGEVEWGAQSSKLKSWLFWLQLLDRLRGLSL